jgi:hypothetical protein
MFILERRGEEQTLGHDQALSPMSLTSRPRLLVSKKSNNFQLCSSMFYRSRKLKRILAHAHTSRGIRDHTSRADRPNDPVRITIPKRKIA